MPPLGMACITSYLRYKDIPTTLIDMQVSEKDVNQHLSLHKPKIVGIGGTTHTRFESFHLARQVKLFDSNITVLYGGSHATFTAEDTLKHIPEIDIIVRGEGELTTYKITDRLLRGNNLLLDIPGISFRNNGKILHNPDAERIKNLDILPFPFRDPEAIKQYNLKLDFLGVPAASVISSRGCPINCSFCSASAMFGTQLTFRSAINIVDEIEILLKEYQYEGVKFFDSTLTLYHNHIEALCAEIQRRKLKFLWECEIRANGISQDLLRTMRDAGCYYVDFGVESASSSVLKTMRKGIHLEHVKNVFRWAKELGIRTKVFFSFGHIGETLDDAKATVQFMDQYVKYIGFAVTGIGVRIYPGTDVEKYAHLIGSMENFSWSAPFLDLAIESLGNDPTVPVLIQPQFGWREFRKIELRLAQFWTKNPRAALTVIWRQIKLGGGRKLVKFVFRFFEVLLLRQKSK